MKLKLSTNVICAVLILLTQTFTFAAIAAPFSAGISPPRFEFNAKQGQVIRDTLVILNANDQFSDYRFHTTDWDLNEDGGVTYTEDTMLANSCRPWVKLERKTVRIRPGGQKKYRFEVHVPKDAEQGLCKFGIIIEPGEQKTAKAGENIKFPVVGRYAVIVYITVGAAKADIKLLGVTTKVENKLTLPALSFKNTGDTLGRPFGYIEATNPDGSKNTLIISDFPVLPGRTETLLLHPDYKKSNAKVDLVYPLKIKGRIEFHNGTSIELDQIVKLVP